MAAPVSHVSPFSGSWYPADPSALGRLVDDLFERSAGRASPHLKPGAVGFVVPHAGLAYSGLVAAAVYRHLERWPPQRVFLLGFSHRGSRAGVWIPEVSAIGTPSGEVQVDREAAARLLEHREFGALDEDQLCDHSVEIQMPLLRRAAPLARLVPIYVSRPARALREAAAGRLAEILAPGDVLIASSDFTHYGHAFGFQPFPVDGNTRWRLLALDEEMIEAAGSLQSELFLEALRRTRSTVCGYEPIGLMLDALRARQGEDDFFQETLDYQTSGEITGDFEHSVSYAALAYFPAGAYQLGEEDARLLVDSARRTLEHYQRTGQAAPQPPSPASEALARRGAAFVSLHKGKHLRGCVGRCEGATPLAEIVPEMTLAAALDDSRFAPLDPSETGIDIEVSLLSPMKRIGGMNEFRVNVHGAFVKAGGRHGLLLPQVASERGWNAKLFFGALAGKMGVPFETFQEAETRLYVFRAQVLH